MGYKYGVAFFSIIADLFISGKGSTTFTDLSFIFVIGSDEGSDHEREWEEQQIRMGVSAIQQVRMGVSAIQQICMGVSAIQQICMVHCN